MRFWGWLASSRGSWALTRLSLPEQSSILLARGPGCAGRVAGLLLALRAASQSVPAARSSQPASSRESAHRELWQPLPACSDTPLVNNVLVVICLPARGGERILSGDLYTGGVKPKGLLGAAVY